MKEFNISAVPTTYSTKPTQLKNVYLGHKKRGELIKKAYQTSLKSRKIKNHLEKLETLNSMRNKTEKIPIFDIIAYATKYPIEDEISSAKERIKYLDRKFDSIADLLEYTQ